MNTNTILAGLGLALVAGLPAAAHGSNGGGGGCGGNGNDVCRGTAFLQAQAAFFELREEYFTNRAVCRNLTDADERAECYEEAQQTFEEDRELAHDRLIARLELCSLLGPEAYDPEIDPDCFSSVIDNPYLPFPVGAEWRYESMTDEGLETVHVEVLAQTREILGVECVSVRDVVSLDGEDVEDTIDWYAQDCDGNVWYFGEISFTLEDGFVESIEGSWLAGLDGAKPGIVMLANPTVGTTYRQEWLLGEAEDAATVLAIDETVVLGIGTFTGCVKTADFLPPEPDALEHKFYAPGIGFVRETVPGEPETLELVSYSGL